MDVQMPILDGIKATEVIRKQQLASNKKVPIIALTANAMEGDRERYIAAGMDGYLAKPIHMRSFISTLEVHLAHRKPV